MTHALLTSHNKIENRQLYGYNSIDATYMHEIAITRPQFDETEMYEVCSQAHSPTSHQAFRRHLRRSGTAATTQPTKAIFRTCEGKPAGQVRGSLAVKAERGCWSAERVPQHNGKNLTNFSLYT